MEMEYAELCNDCKRACRKFNSFIAPFVGAYEAGEPGAMQALNEAHKIAEEKFSAYMQSKTCSCE